MSTKITLEYTCTKTIQEIHLYREVTDNTIHLEITSKLYDENDNFIKDIEDIDVIVKDLK